MKKILLTLSAVAFIANAASAITLSGFAATSLKGADTNDLVAGSSTYLIADGGDGFDFDATVAGLTFAAGSTIGATNDFVFQYTASASFGAGFSVASGNTSFTNTSPSTGSGHAFALLFFDGVGGASVTTAGGENFGFVTPANWLIPANDAGTFSFGADFTQLTAATGTTGTVVPEPSTYATLAGLLALGAVMVPRRRA